MSRKKKARICECRITRFSQKGNGVGSAVLESGGQLPMEVPFAVPGDRIQAQCLRKKKGRYLSKLLEILEPAPERIAPRCIHFGECGGCRWQQIPYQEQLKRKSEAVHQCFVPLLKDSTVFLPIVPCEDPWRYRNKMEFTFSQDAEGKRFLGLILSGSKGKALDLQECHLVNSWFIDALKAVRQWWEDCELEAYRPLNDRGSLRTLTIREGMRTGDRMVMLTVSGNPEYAIRQHYLEDLVSVLRQAVEPSGNQRFSIFLRIQHSMKGMATTFYEMHLHGADSIQEKMQISLNREGPSTELLFSISPTAFFQPNTYQAEKLYSTALQMVGIEANSVVYDLYCGTGTLGICAAQKAKQVVGIEISPESVLDARTNVAQNGLDNITIMSGAVRHVLSQVIEEGRFPKPDLVMVDPPRPGLDPEALKNLIHVSPKKILYISCNPVTQAENCIELLKEGYRIEAIRPVDQFPQTPHIENIVVLSKQDGVV